MKKYRYTNVPSILQGEVPETEAYSYVSGLHTNIEFHHIMNGTKHFRKLSEEHGLWIWLTRAEHDKLHHTPEGIAYQLTLKQECQALFEKRYSRDRWMRLFHKNYL